ncbi:MAG: hypothetical protein AB7O80_27600 [Acetobacteraceae bacterium]
MTTSFELPATIHDAILADLANRLPPVPADSPRSREERDRLVLATILALEPGNAEELEIAIQAVVADTHAIHCLYLAGQHRADVGSALRYRDQALARMRESQKAFAALHRAQTTRRTAQRMAAKTHAARSTADRHARPDMSLRTVSDDELIERLAEARRRIFEAESAADPVGEPTLTAETKPLPPEFVWPPISPTIH